MPDEKEAMLRACLIVRVVEKCILFVSAGDCEIHTSCLAQSKLLRSGCKSKFCLFPIQVPPFMVYLR